MLFWRVNNTRGHLGIKWCYVPSAGLLEPRRQDVKKKKSPPNQDNLYPPHLAMPSPIKNAPWWIIADILEWAKECLWNVFTEGWPRAVSEFVLILPLKGEMETFFCKAERVGADLVGQALSLQLLFFESLLQGKNLGLVFLHCQLHHLARLGDPLVSSRPAREAQAHFQETHTTDLEREGWSISKQAAGWTAQPWTLPLNVVFLPDSLQSKNLTHFWLGLKLPWSSKVPMGTDCGETRAEEGKAILKWKLDWTWMCPALLLKSCFFVPHPKHKSTALQAGSISTLGDRHQNTQEGDSWLLEDKDKD